MKYISFLIKSASSLCNMQCQYCFYKDVSEKRLIKSYGIMNLQVMQAIIDRALAFDKAADITFAFQGGEPTLAGLDYFQAFIDYVNKYREDQIIHYAIQTNGSLLNDEWATFFKQNEFLVGISLDGYADIHNYLRKGINNNVSFSQVMKAIHLLKHKEVNFNILTVLSATLAKHPQKLFSFYCQQNFKYVQFIPCLKGLDEEENPYALSPRQFSTFYKTYFTLWLKEFQKGNYWSVTLFDNVIGMLAGNQPQQCGMLGKCAMQFVMEGNGNVYPCDFYVLDRYCCGNIVKDDLKQLIECDTFKAFLKEPRRCCKDCEDCPFQMICHRNCKRLNQAYYDENYCGYRDFLSFAYPDMVKIAAIYQQLGGK